MERRRSVVGFLLVFLVFHLFVPVLATADGGFFPETGLPVPDLPGQRAIISYRDGIETLMIESTVNQGSRTAWILPVPSGVISIENGSVGLIKTMGLQLSPALKHPDQLTLIFYASLMVVMFLMCLIPIFDSFRWIIPMTIVYFFVLMVVPPNFIVYRAGSYVSGTEMEEAVRVLQSERVGNYNTTVLQATSYAVLNKWLYERGFAEMDEKAERIIDGYIRDGWYFLVSDLAGSGGDHLQTHPLEITLAVGQPVYPMRLTAIHDGPLLLDFFIVADKGVSTRDCVLETIFRDQFMGIDKEEAEHWAMGKEGFRAKKLFRFFGATLAHPDTQRLLWPGCWITRLRGEVFPGRLRTDIHFDENGETAYQAYRFSSRAVVVKWLKQCAVLFFIGLCILLWMRKKGASDRKLRWVGLVVLPCVTFLVSSPMVLSIESVPVRNSRFDYCELNNLSSIFSDLFAIPVAYTDEELLSALHGTVEGEGARTRTPIGRLSWKPHRAISPSRERTAKLSKFSFTTAAVSNTL